MYLPLMPLLLLVPAGMFVWWGWSEGDREDYVLASIYLAGAIAAPFLFLILPRS